MDIKEILSKCDHTLLSQSATWEQIKSLCLDGIKYGTASVCIPASYVKAAKEFVGDKLKICTVIGFPNGYSPTTIKCLEASNAVADGAGEVDMVINLGAVKSGDWALVERDIAAVVTAVDGEAKVKVIIETCLLTDEEKVLACQAAKRVGADFVKTSTGFSTGGATVHDVKLMRETVGPEMGVKASGGVRSYEDAIAMIEAGASRLGASSGKAIIEGCK